jgi:hypothetical protein
VGQGGGTRLRAGRDVAQIAAMSTIAALLFLASPAGACGAAAPAQPPIEVEAVQAVLDLDEEAPASPEPTLSGAKPEAREHSGQPDSAALANRCRLSQLPIA